MAEAAIDIDHASEREPDSPRLLRVVGKQQLFAGRADDAITTLERARTAAGGPTDRADWEISYLLGRAYQQNGQLEEAEKIMAEVSARLDYFPAQLTVAQLMLQRGALDEASVQIEILARLHPDNPQVRQLEIELAAARKRQP